MKLKDLVEKAKIEYPEKVVGMSDSEIASLILKTRKPNYKEKTETTTSTTQSQATNPRTIKANPLINATAGGAAGIADTGLNIARTVASVPSKVREGLTGFAKNVSQKIYGGTDEQFEQADKGSLSRMASEGLRSGVNLGTDKVRQLGKSYADTFGIDTQSKSFKAGKTATGLVSSALATAPLIKGATVAAQGVTGANKATQLTGAINKLNVSTPLKSKLVNWASKAFTGAAKSGASTLGYTASMKGELPTGEELAEQGVIDMALFGTGKLIGQAARKISTPTTKIIKGAEEIPVEKNRLKEAFVRLLNPKNDMVKAWGTKAKSPLQSALDTDYGTAFITNKTIKEKAIELVGDRVGGKTYQGTISKQVADLIENNKGVVVDVNPVVDSLDKSLNKLKVSPSKNSAAIGAVTKLKNDLKRVMGSDGKAPVRVIQKLNMDWNDLAPNAFSKFVTDQKLAAQARASIPAAGKLHEIMSKYIPGLRELMTEQSNQIILRDLADENLIKGAKQSGAVGKLMDQLGMTGIALGVATQNPALLLGSAAVVGARELSGSPTAKIATLKGAQALGRYELGTGARSLIGTGARSISNYLQR